MVVNVEFTVLRHINITYGLTSVGLLSESQTCKIKTMAREGSFTSKISIVRTGLITDFLYINDYSVLGYSIFYGSVKSVLDKTTKCCFSNY